MTVVARDVDIVIVGGGIVGASCAYFLAERGAELPLLEAGRIGREPSGVNPGGVRQQAPAPPELPLPLASVRLLPDPARRPHVPPASVRSPANDVDRAAICRGLEIPSLDDRAQGVGVAGQVDDPGIAHLAADKDLQGRGLGDHIDLRA